MVGKKMEKALNKQINAEMFSSYLYLSMSAYYESINLPGFANWMMAQSREEMEHAMKIYHYIFDCGGRVELDVIEKPQAEWKSPQAPFEDALKHEKKITSLINQLMDLAMDEKDHATIAFLQWFITEQVEEESQTDDVVQKLKMIEGSKNGLFMMDRELAGRQADGSV